MRGHFSSDKTVGLISDTCCALQSRACAHPPGNCGNLLLLLLRKFEGRRNAKPQSAIAAVYWDGGSETQITSRLLARSGQQHLEKGRVIADCGHAIPPQAELYFSHPHCDCSTNWLQEVQVCFCLHPRC